MKDAKGRLILTIEEMEDIAGAISVLSEMQKVPDVSNS
jgi:hypothetical protein